MTITDPAQFGKVAVILGGDSAEREVSLKSGEAVWQGLRRRGVDADKVDANEDLGQVLRGGGYDRAFIVVHGKWGEDGILQGFLEVLGIPYTGSGVLGSALGMDKLRTKTLWSGLGLPTPPYFVMRERTEAQACLRRLGVPVIVKPVNQGSSLGMAKAETVAELEQAWLAARRYDENVLVEKWITGAEYTAAFLGEEMLPLIRLETPRVFYDYHAKYSAGDTQYVIPCGLEEHREHDLQQLCQAAYQALGCSGWGRVDFMIGDGGEPYLLEVNTVPGMTDHSLVPMAARYRGIDFDELVWRILAQTV